ncbi:MAG TPA: hypothetical protein DGU02_05340 [Alphaproteobacteria bacterium]|nr:hypothetical protein [Alphaproteobacteria bacterium]|tara:strand:+ start:8243 stop:8716 length:474 start_codon:yes stop_codon:yes gene_type:complete
MMTGFDDAGFIFGQMDQLARAKLALIFAIHLVCFVALLRVAATQPTSFLHRAPFLVGSLAGSAVGGVLLGGFVVAASILAGRHSGLATVLFLNAGVISLYVIEFTILLSRGFFRRLLDDALQPEIRVAISFIVMVNAGYFTLMFLKDILLSDSLGVR